MNSLIEKQEEEEKNTNRTQAKKRREATRSFPTIKLCSFIFMGRFGRLRFLQSKRKKRNGRQRLGKKCQNFN